MAHKMELLNARSAALRGLGGAPLKYSLDGKFLFQREACVVRVLSATNGQLLHECVRPTTTNTSSEEATPCRLEVTAIALHPTNALQLMAAYEDGKGWWFRA